MLGFGPICSAPICELPATRFYTDAYALDNFQPSRKKSRVFVEPAMPLEAGAAPVEDVTVDKWHPYQQVPFRRRQFTPPVCDYPFFDIPEFGDASNRTPVTRRRPMLPDADTQFVEPVPAPVQAECPIRPNRPDQSIVPRGRPDACEREV